jgi:integrase
VMDADENDRLDTAMRIDKIGVAEVERFKASQIAKKTRTGTTMAKTINNRLTVLRRMLVIAMDWNLLAFVPRVRLMKTPAPPFRFLSFTEADQVLADAGEWRSMVLVALRTGLRHGELLALRWEDVDLQNSRLVVRRTVWRGIEGTPKGGRSREVPLSGEAVAALRELPSRFRKAYVFGTGDRRLTHGETKWPLWSICKRVGIDRFGWHVLRHTFASQLVMKGVPLKAVQELLGHATLEMTMRYAHLSPEVRTDAVNRLDGPIMKGASAEAAS